MSSVDERIVEMRFDNQQFESGVQRSLHTLDRLKNGLNLEDSAKSLESLQTSANSFDLSGVTRGVDAISNRVSALGIVGDQVIRYLTNQFIQLGEAAARTVKSLTIDQIGTGFDKYERKTKAVQTIMNATGESIESVTASLEKLGWFTDETSYGYSDMVDNIGKFTSNNIKLDSAVTSMIGIANAAGLAGSSVSDAAHAMEGFSKAMGRGSMDSRSWSWIQTAHMDTAQFKQTLIDAAVEVGTLDKVMSKDGQTYEYFVHGNKKAAVSIADFQNELSKGWLNVDAMTLALHQFGGATEEIYKIFQEHDGEMLTSEIISKYGSSLDELGIKAFKASQEARTFTDAIDSVKEAVSTGWASSFEYIFGNKEEAVALWSEVAEELYNIFAEPGNHRNELLKSWYEAGGRDDLLAGIRNVWEGIKVISETAKEAFADLFPSLTGEKLVGLTKKIKNFTKAFKDNFIVANYRTDEDSFWNHLLDTGSLQWSYLKSNEELVNSNLQKLKDAFGGLASIIDLVKSGFKAFGKVLSPILSLFKINAGSILNFLAVAGKFTTNLVESIKNSELLESVIDGLTKVVSRAVSSFKLLGGTIITIFNRVIKSKAFKSIPQKVMEMVSSFQELVGKKLMSGFEKIASFFEELASDENIDKFLNNIDSMLQGLEDFIAEITPAYEAVKNFFTPVVTAIGSAFMFAYDHIVPAITAVKNFWTELINSDNPISVIMDKFSKLGTYVDDVKNRLAKLFGYGSFEQLFASLDPSIEAVQSRITSMLDKIGEAIKNANWGKILATAIGLSTIPVMLQIGMTFRQLSGLLKSLAGLSSTFTNFLKRITGEYKNGLLETAKAVFIFASSVALLAGSLKLISTIPEDTLIRSGTALGALAGGLVAFGLVFGVLGAIGKIKDLDKSALGLLEIASALAILSGSLLLIQKLSRGDIKKGGVVIGGLMVMLGIFAAAIKDTKATFAGNGLIFLSFAASIFLLVESIKRLSAIKNFDLEGSLLAIGTLMTIMAAFAVIQRLGKGSFGMGPGILSMTLSLLLLMKAASMLGEAKIAEIAENAKKNILLIGILFGALLGLSLIARAGGKSSGKTGLAILAMSASLLIVYAAVKKFGELKAGILTKGVLAVVAIMFAFSKLSRIEGWATPIGPKVGIGIALMAASLLVVYQAVKKFGNLDIPELVQGLASVMLIFGSFAGVMAASAKTVKVGPIIAMAVAITVLVGAIAYLTLLNDFEGLIKSATVLSMVMLAFGGAVALMGKAKFDKAGFMSYVGGIAAIATIGFALYKLKDIPWPQLLGTGGAISAVLIGMGTCMRLLQTSGWNRYEGASVAAFAGGLIAVAAIGYILSSMVRSDIPWQSMASFGGTITAVIIGVAAAMRIVQHVDAGAALGPLAEIIGFIAVLSLVLGALSWLANEAGFDDSNVVQVQRIGAMLGGFFGGILGGFISGTGLGMSIALPMIATNLSNFITNLQPFIDGVGKLDDSFGTKLDALGAGLMKIGSAEVKDGWANLLNSIAGGSGKTPNLGENMKALGKGLADFNMALAGVDAKQLSTNIDTLATMLTTMKKVPKTRNNSIVGNFLDGVEGAFIGKTDYSKFSTAMSEMGKALGSFAESTKDINIEEMTPAVDTFGKIMGMFGKIPKTGPLINFFSGKTEWSTISNGLEEFGKALSGYSKAVSGDNAPDLAAIENSIKPAEALNELLQKIPGVSVFSVLFDGVTSWSVISTGLVEFGEALVGYSTAVKGEAFDADAITSSASAAEALASLEGKIPTAGSWWQDTFGGNVSWSTISQGLEDFGTALKGYSDAVGGGQLDIESMDGASTAAQKVVDACLLFRDSGMTKGEIGILGTGLEEFGSHLKGMSDMMVQFDTVAIDTVLESLHKLSDAKTTYETLGGELAEMIVSKFQLGLNSENATTIAGDFMTNISTGLTTGEANLTAIGESCANAFISGLTSKNETVLQTGTDVGSKASSGISTALAGMVSVGSQAAQGLINGLSGMLGAAYAAGYAIGQSVVSGSKAGLDAHSPSRLMRQVGEFAGEGLGLGLLSMTNYVSDSAEKMAEGSILSVSSVFDRIDAALSGDIDYSPVITPVLDLSAISYGASQIDGILNQDASLRMAGQIQTTQVKQDIAQFLALGNAILKEIQNGSDLYFDDGAFAGRINRRLGSL